MAGQHDSILKTEIINTKIKIILIGPVTNVAASLIGGATISFGYLIDYFKKHQEHFNLINTQKIPKGVGRLLNPFYVLIKVLLHAPSSNVIFLNSSRGGTKYLVPLVFLIAKLFRLKFVFRPFGGDIKDYTALYSNFQKYLFQKTVLQADIFFLQTKELMQYYASQNANTIQLPTSRVKPPQELQRPNRPYQKRFIFLGFINEPKGIEQLLEANKILGPDYTIHIYGPIKEAKYEQIFNDENDLYKGVLSKEEVLPTLQKYDVLILPTYYRGEGYPGSILEAYSLGLPVISTNWKAIPEIVEHKKTGYLIEPKSTEELVSAIQYFNQNNYPSFSQNAIKYFEQNFDTEQVTNRVVNKIKGLFENKKVTPKIVQELKNN